MPLPPEILPVTVRLTPRDRTAPEPASGTSRDTPSDESERCIYIASPVSTYQSRRYDLMSSRVAQRYPGATIMVARGMYESSHDWRKKWPEVLPRIDEFVFFAELDGTVGMGVCKELHDADMGGIPIWYLHHDGRWFEPDVLEFTITGLSPAKYAVVELAEDADARTDLSIGGA